MITKDEITIYICSYALFLKEMLMFKCPYERKYSSSNEQLWDTDTFPWQDFFPDISLTIPWLLTTSRAVAGNLICVGKNCTISNLSWVKETKQPHKKFKVDWFGGVYPDIPPCRYAHDNIPDISLTCFKFPDISRFSRQVVTLRITNSVSMVTVRPQNDGLKISSY